jgi:hypothetical protein
MDTAAQQKAWIAKIVGSCYFVLIGFAYSVMELVAGQFTFGDFGVLVWSCLPMLINKRWMYLCFGGLNLFIWAYLALEIIFKGNIEFVSLLVISSVAFGALVSAMLLIYSAVNISEKRFSLI